jgi:capsular exopolysaccharide synthesis family protein
VQDEVKVNTSVPENFSGDGDDKRVMLTDFIRTFRKYLWLFAVMSVGLSLAAYLWSKTQRPQYDAMATVQVDQHGSLSLSSAMGGLTDDYELKITTQIIALQSRDVAIEVIRDLNLQNDKRFNPYAPQFTDLTSPRTREYLENKFSEALDVERLPRTELITISFRSYDPVLSATVVNKVIDTYMELNFNHRYQGSKEITGWLTKELGDLKARVESEQRQLLDLSIKTGIFSSGANNETSVYETQLNDLIEEITHAQTQRFMADEQYHTIADGDSSAYPNLSLPGVQVLTPLNSQLAALESQRSALAARYGPGYEPLKQLDQQVESLKKTIEEQRQKIIAGANESAEAQTKTLGDLQAKLDAMKADAKAMNPDAVQYQILKSEYTADQALYNGLLALLSAGGIEAGLKAQEVNRLTVADIPALPSRPRIALNTAAGFGIGLLLSLLVVGIIVAVSDTVETVEQVEESLSLPVLAAVPVYKLEPTETPGLMVPLATLSAPRSAGAEAYRILRTAINLMPGSDSCRVIGITSCGPGEGKSTTILNLALSFAQQGKKVLLIDADLRKPVLTQRLKLTHPSAPGLTRYLSTPALRPEECIQSSEAIAGLNVMPVQETPPFPSELLGQGRLNDLVIWARKNFDIVLFDTPPLLLVTDALIVAPSLDIILVVARIGQAQRRALRRVREELRRFADKHIAVVVNAVPQSQSYYGGYGNYHGYYGDKKDS